MKWATVIFGVGFVLIGGLWFLQGLGILEIEPIFCVSACEPIKGKSAQWAIIGILTMAVGIAAIVFSLRGRRGK